MIIGEKNYLTKKRDIIVLTSLLSILLTIAGYIYYHYEENAIRKEKYTELSGIAELKSKEITNWYEDEAEDAEILSRNPILLQNIGKWLKRKSSSNEQIIYKEFTSLKEEHNYENILLTDANGLLLYSPDSNLKQIDSTIHSLINEAILNKKVVTTDLYWNENNNKIQLGFISPLDNEDNETIASLVFLIDPNHYLYPFIQSWPTPSKSAETILVRKDENSVLFLNELRHAKGTALKLRFNLTQKEIPAVRAVLGYKDVFEGIDYRGIDVLSDIRDVPGTPWFMIAKIDKYEIFEELNFRLWVIIIFILILLSLFVAGLAWMYNYRQSNIYKELYVKEKELWESQEEFKTTLYSIGDGVITTDTRGNVKQMNPEAERLTGWKESDASGQPLERVFNIINEETQNKVEGPVQRVLREGIVVGLANHTLLISKDEKETPIADSGAPIKDENGVVIGVVLVFQDQTKERKAEEALRISQYSIDYASVAIFWMTKDGGFSYVNDLACSSLGYTREELLKLKLWNIDPEYPKSHWHKNWEQYQIDRQGGEEHIETLHRRKDGSLFPVEVSSKHIWFGEKELHVAFVRDISENKKAEAALKESEERLRLALQAANQGIYDLNIQTGDAKVTPEYAKMLGYDPKVFVETNSKWIERLHPEDRDKVAKVYQDYVAGELPEYRVEFRQRTKSNDWKWILSLGKIVERNLDGNPLRMLGTHTDITDRKKNEREIIEAKEKAENSEKLKSEFLAQMSHEIRSPIYIILSYVDIIRESVSNKIDKDLLPSFESIKLAGDRIIRTIDLILNMSDLQLGTYEITYKSFTLSSLLQSLIREYLQPASDKKIKIEFKNEAVSTDLVSDEYAVSQIFANLIDNAVKYTQEGTITVKVFNEENGRIVTQVSDTGVGISEEYIPVLFSPFSQEEQGYTRKYDGNGLGLSLVKKYCDLLEAEISVESEKNKGAIFTVKFNAKNTN